MTCLSGSSYRSVSRMLFRVLFWVNRVGPSQGPKVDFSYMHGYKPTHYVRSECSDQTERTLHTGVDRENGVWLWTPNTRERDR